MKKKEINSQFSILNSQLKKPRLRFPEFKNSGEWEEKELGEIGELSGSGVDKKIRDNEKKVKLLNYLDVYKKNFITSDDLQYETTATEQQIKKCEIKKGDVFFTPTSEIPDDIAQSAVALEDIKNAVYSYHLVRFRLKERWDVRFRTYVFKTKIFFDTVSKLAQGSGTRYVITLPEFRSIKVLVPSLPEQQKIADFLSNLDELIEAHKKKLEFLKQHKKGLMQSLFPAEGEKVPKLRFPEFKDSGEWNLEILGSLTEIKGRIGYRGYTRADIVEKGKGAITLSPTNFDENGKLNFENSTYISWEKYEESPEIMLEEGDTVLVKTASVGKCAYVENLPEKTTINPQIVILKPRKINPKFLSYSIFHTYVQNQIKKYIGVGAIPNMSQASIAKINILLPPKEEQQKIADFLSSLDELIDAEEKKIEQLERHKKGLMQGLFPEI